MGKLSNALQWAVLLVLVAPLLAQIAFVVLPGAGCYTVTSGSMEPSIRTGSLVYVYETGEYATGDVVTFSVEGTTVTHRIVDETAEGYVTKGDTQERADSWTVSRVQIRGEVLVSVPSYGYLLRPFSTAGMALYGILGGGAFVYYAGRELLWSAE